MVSFNFTRPSKSHLTYQFLSLINSARLKIYSPDEAPAAVFEECMKQIKLARYRIPGEDIMTMYVDAAEGHDDFLMSIALCCEAARDMGRPVLQSQIVRPRRLYEGESRF